MKSREGSFDGEGGFSQELSPRNASPEQLKGRVEALEGELALSVARGEGPADANQAEPHKFVANTLVLGKPEEAAHGLSVALGLTRSVKAQGEAKCEQAIIDEFQGPHASEEDKANLNYVLYGKALHQIPQHVKQQIAKGKYHGGELKPDDFDRGHEGMRLDDFVEHESSKFAKLDRAEVLALRLYTTTSYTHFNKPLRERTKPHPFAFSVLFLAEGLRKLKAVNCQISEREQEQELWRGMANMQISEEFKKKGGSELAPMSTSAAKATAFGYATSAMPLIFKYTVEGMTRGCSIDFLSVYPGEKEFLYPPLTYIRYKGEETVDGVTVVVVEPQQA